MIVGDDRVSEKVMHASDRLKIIAKWGVGVDGIDLGAAKRLGISVANTPAVFGDEVADVVIGYLVMLSRRLHAINAGVQSGEWPKPEGVSLGGRKLGIVGLGDIGLAVARRAIAMKLRIFGVDPMPERRAEAAQIGASVVGLDRLLAESDIISLNTPLTAGNHHMLDQAAFAAMKRDVWIINTARGGLVDERALLAALDAGQVGAAALDVFEDEPLPASSGLRHRENVILGSHNSSNTAEAVLRTNARAVANLLAGLGLGSQ
jgi:D-3-phosphoglycerate dehydrogenase